MLTFRSLLLLALLAVTAAIGAGFLGALHPAFDTLSHFRLHLSVLLLGLAFLWSFRCSRMPSIGFALAGFAALVTCGPGLPLAGGGVRSGAPVYSLLSMNLYFLNSDPAAVVTMIRERRPDIAVLSEVSRPWLPHLAEVADILPNRYHCPEHRQAGGTMILTRFPIDSNATWCSFYAAFGTAPLTIDGARVEIGSVHLRWPWPASGPAQVTSLEPKLATLGPDALVAGDFNAVTWSHTLRRFARHGGLTVQGGIGPTWLHDALPSGLIAWIGFPIDNVMSKGRVRIVSARTLPPAGSDHLPVLVEFQLAGAG